MTIFLVKNDYSVVTFNYSVIYSLLLEKNQFWPKFSS